ncbi:hypothetical protein [Methanocella sp. MCL-LM]|uniref:hypothetical protein n=1 Tax=Methanocella sp. MCL-LM TaxID=3412035 RepID=UPI003C78D646
MTDILYFYDDGENRHWHIYEPGIGDDELRSWASDCEECGWPIHTFVRGIDPDSNILEDLSEILFDEYHDDDALVDHVMDRFDFNAAAFAEALVARDPEGCRELVKQINKRLKR